MSDFDARLAALGITLPVPAAPVANYVPFVQSGSQVFISGQVSLGADGLVKGTLGADMDVAAGQAAARLCAINLIAQLKAACGGDLGRLVRVVKLGGFVAAQPGFTDIPQVINGRGVWRQGPACPFGGLLPGPAAGSRGGSGRRVRDRVIKRRLAQHAEFTGAPSPRRLWSANQAAG